LVTGGAGFIGAHVATRLREQGVDVTLVDDFSRGRRDATVDELLASVRIVEHDLTHSLPAELADKRFSQVFHLAAVVGVRRVGSAPASVLRTNLLSTINVLEWCSRQQPDSFFLSSTSEIGDGARELLGESPSPSEGAPVAFKDPLLPRGAYAVSKLTCELLVANYARQAGFRARIGRYHNVFGPRMGYEHVIPELMQRAHAKASPFPVFSVDQSRAFCYIDDAVDATLALMGLDDPEPIVANIGNDLEELRIGDLAGRILQIVGHQAEIDPQPPPPGSPDRRRPDLRRIKELTSWRPKISLDQGLRRTWAWYSADLDDLYNPGEGRVAAR
jgi:UDP-glucuronate decarboxylase